MTDDTTDEELEEWRDGVPIVPPPDPEAILGDDWLAPEDATPADEVVAAVDEGALDVTVAPATDEEELREFLDRADRGEFGSHPGIEAAVRIVRDLLEDDREE